MRDRSAEERRMYERKGVVPFRRTARRHGTLNASARIPQQFAKITAVICRRLCSYRSLVLVCPYTYTGAPPHGLYTCMDTEDRALSTHTYIGRRGIIASEHARSNFRSAFLALSSLSLPLYTPSTSIPWATSSVSILYQRPNPLNASASVHVHPNRLYLHLIASSKVLLRHV